MYILIEMFAFWTSLTSVYLRARTQELEQQQPGVEGELRRLLEKPGKRSRTLRSVTLCFQHLSL